MDATIIAGTEMTSDHPPYKESGRDPDIERELDDLAHALRSPLTALRGGLEMLDESGRAGLNDAGLRGLDVALSATKRLTALIDDTLLLARHRAGRLEPSLEVEAAGEVVREALRLHPDLAMTLDYAFEPGTEDIELVVDVGLVATLVNRVSALVSPMGESTAMRVSMGERAAVFKLSGGLAYNQTGAQGAGASALEVCRTVVARHGGTFEIGPKRDGQAGTAARFTLPTAE